MKCLICIVKPAGDFFWPFELIFWRTRSYFLLNQLFLFRILSEDAKSEVISRENFDPECRPGNSTTSATLRCPVYLTLVFIVLRKFLDY